MGHLVISFFAAFVVAVAAYLETSSILVTLLAYSATGTIVLLTAFISTMFALDGERDMNALEG